MAEKCIGITKSGNKCSTYRVKESEYCYRHAPERREEFLATSGKGGSVKRWHGIDEVMQLVRGPLGAAVFIEQVISKVLSGEIPPHVATVLISATNALINAFKVASTTQKGTKDIDSPVVLIHDDEPQRYELTWDFDKRELSAEENDDPDDTTDVTTAA